MRIIALSIPLAAALLTTPASAQSFLGEWRATAQVPDQPVAETLTVTRTASGYSVTAKDVNPAPPPEMQAGPGVEVVLDGDTFSYKRVIQTPNGALEIVYKGTISGDTFTGTGEVGGYSIPYNGVRLNKAG
jgi:hypothetical protein